MQKLRTHRDNAAAQCTRISTVSRSKSGPRQTDLFIVRVHPLVDLIDYPERAWCKLLQRDEEEHNGDTLLATRESLALVLDQVATSLRLPPEHDKDLETIVLKVVVVALLGLF